MSAAPQVIDHVQQPLACTLCGQVREWAVGRSFRGFFYIACGEHGDNDTASDLLDRWMRKHLCPLLNENMVPLGQPFRHDRGDCSRCIVDRHPAGFDIRGILDPPRPARPRRARHCKVCRRSGHDRRTCPTAARQAGAT